MALTSQQKHYIKKNLAKTPYKKIASDLDLPEKIILKYLKKHLSDKLYQKIASQNIAPEISNSSQNTSFNLKQFCFISINYFVLFFILIFVIYLNAFDNAFVSDDIQGIAQSPVWSDWKNLQHLSSWKFLHRFILFKLGLVAPFYFRIINIIFHFGSTCLIFIIFNILTKKKTLALFTALLFATHPILIESVSWISAEPYSRYGFFFLTSFLFFLLALQGEKRTRQLLFFSVLSFFLALFSSEKAIALFFVFPLYTLTFDNWWKNWKKFLPFFLITLIFAISYLSNTGQRIDALNTDYYSDISGFNNPLVQIPIAISAYLGLIFWPQGLTLYHSEISFDIATYLPSLFVFFLFGGLLFYGWKKNRFLFFWLSFFFISLMPTLTPLKISWIVAERYVYIGTLGILAVVAYFFIWLKEKIPTKKNWFNAIFAIIIFLLSLRVIIRNIDWDNEDNLWIATAKTSPSGHVIHNNLGDVYTRQKDYPKAISEFEKATQINPRYADAFHNLANTYQTIGKTEEALVNYQKALELNPKLWQTAQNLALLYFQQEDFQKAHEMIEKALVIDPTNSNLQENLKLIETKL